jgi:hypothetical protein
MQSRFSVPSMMSRHSALLPRTVPAFLALPINHIRQSSGRFPAMVHGIRKSFVAARPSGPPTTPAWAQKYSDPMNDINYSNDYIPPVPPVPINHPYQATAEAYGGMDDRRVAPHINVSAPPQLELRRQSSSRLEWGHSYSPSPGSGVEQLRSQPDFGRGGDLETTNQNPLESFYSKYSQQTGTWHGDDHLHMPDALGNIGQALTTAGRESIEALVFPMPPTNTHGPSHLSPPNPTRRPSVTRTLTSASIATSNQPQPESAYLGITTNHEHDNLSELFEFADYANGLPSRHHSHATAHSRASGVTKQTRDWYENSYWDGESQAGPSVYIRTDRSRLVPQNNGNQGNRASEFSRTSVASGVWTLAGDQADAGSGDRKSRSKSVRWGDEEPLPKVFELARAL